MTEPLFQIPPDWEVSTVGEVATRGGGNVQTGPFGSQLHAANYVEQGIPSVMPQNIGDNTISIEGIARIRLEDAERLSKYRLKTGDIIYSRRGDVEKRSLVRPENDGWLCGTGCLRIRFGTGHVVPEFAGYYLAHPAAKAWVVQHAVGATMPNLNTKILASLPFVLPPLCEQKTIAFVLSNLDDKIELNRRMNETLEAMAQAIFRDWFVDFGPTRRMIDGATDPVEIMGGLVSDPDRARELAALFPASLSDDGLPEGWEEKPLGNVFDVVMGQSPPSSTYNEAGNGLPFFQGRRDFGFRFPEERVYCTDPSRIANADWTLVSVRAPVGDVNRATTRCCIGRGVAAVCHKTDLRSFTYYAVLTLKPELARFDGDGTVFGSINQKQMKALAVVGADSPVAQEFEKIAAPIDGLIRSRTEETRTLAITRDLLLPKLMSGEIRLRDAEREIEVVA